MIGSTALIAGIGLLVPVAAQAADLVIQADKPAAMTGETVVVSGSGCGPAGGGEVMVSWSVSDMGVVHTVQAGVDGTWSVPLTMGGRAVTVNASCVDYLGTRDYEPVTIAHPFVVDYFPMMGVEGVEGDAVVAGEKATVSGTACVVGAVAGPDAFLATPVVSLSVTGSADPITIIPADDGTWSHETSIASVPSGVVRFEATCSTSGLSYDYEPVEVPFLARPTVAVDRTTVRAGEKFTVSGTGCRVTPVDGVIKAAVWTVRVDIDGVTVSPGGLTPKADGTWSFETTVAKAKGSRLKVESWCSVGPIPATLRAETTVAFAAKPGSGGGSGSGRSGGKKLSDTGFDTTGAATGGALVLLAGAGLAFAARRRTA